MVGLPDHVRGCLFDMDGVLTRTATDALALHGLGERKNQLLLSLLASAGGFTPVIGVDRTGQAEALRANGADIVVTDLAELMEA
jgi:beta-phosphoglucomutase-like phosphatase (HAD superfamily)